MSGANDEPDGRTIAAYVLHHYGVGRGYSMKAGSFYATLIHAASLADWVTLNRFFRESDDRLLRKIGFCVHQVSQKRNGVDLILQIASGSRDYPELKVRKQ